MSAPQPLPPRPQRKTAQGAPAPTTPSNPPSAFPPASGAAVAHEHPIVAHDQPQVVAPQQLSDTHPEQAQQEWATPQYAPYENQPALTFKFHEKFFSKYMKKTLMFFGIIFVITLIFSIVRHGFSPIDLVLSALMILSIFGVVALVMFILSKTYYSPVIVNMDTRMVTLRGVAKPLSEIKYARFMATSSGQGMNTTMEFGYDSKARIYLFLQNNIMTSSIDEIEFLRYLIPFTSIPVTSAEPKKVFGGMKVLVGRTDMDELLYSWLEAKKAQVAK